MQTIVSAKGKRAGSPKVLVHFALPYLLILLILLVVCIAIFHVTYSSQLEMRMDYYSSTISTSLEMVNRALTNVDGLYMQLARYKPIQDVMLAAGTQRPLKELLKLQDNRLNYQDSTRILDEYLIYSKRSGVVITGKKVLMDPQRSYEQLLQYGELSFDEWRDTILTMTVRDRFYPAEEARTGSPDVKRYLFYVRPYLDLEKGTLLGQVLMYLDEKELLSLIPVEMEQDGVFVQLISNDQLLTGINIDQEMQEIPFPLEKNTPYVRAPLNGVNYYLTYQDSASYPLRLLIGVSENQLRFFCLERLTGVYAIIALLMLLVLLVSMYTIMHNRASLMGIGTMVTGRGNIQDVHQSFRQFYSDNAELSQQLDAQQLRLRDALYRQLIYGFECSDEKMERQMEFAGIRLGGEEIQARAVYLLIDKAEDNLSADETRRRITEEALEPYGDQLRILLLEEGCLLTLLWFCGSEDDFSIFRNIFAQIQEANGFELHFYVGSRFTQLHHARDSFSEARRLLRTDTRREDSFLIVDGGSRTLDAFCFGQREEERMQGAIMRGVPEEISNVLDEIYERNFKQRVLSSQMCRLLYARMISALVCLDARVPLTERELSELRGDLNPADFFRAYRQHIDAMCALIQADKCQAHKEQDEQMLHFIHENYTDSNLSLTMLAMQYGRSESYVSSRLNGILGQSFSTYLEKLRVQEANHLLQETGLTISEISSRIGYNSPSAFGRAYKRVMGLTPTDYLRSKAIKTEEHS